MEYSLSVSGDVSHLEHAEPDLDVQRLESCLCLRAVGLVYCRYEGNGGER